MKGKNILVVGASKGLGRAFVEGLGQDGDTVIGVSRSRPAALSGGPGVTQDWIVADLSDPRAAVDAIEAQSPAALDVIIYNLGLWESRAFGEDYDFLADEDAALIELLNTNTVAAILLLKRLLPRLLSAAKPHIILTGSTSGLPGSGRPEVSFGASKHALRGIAEALREGFRAQRLAVTCLQLGYLNTEDALDRPVAEAAARGAGQLVPVHDVLLLTRALLSLSDASFVKELVLPALLDPRF
ncbi:SDR family NAD(P)-dependent oxidoreductase [Paucibacter sp. O1-1]|nr:SDR family NAD(P)-dependent oxidoreductase [Paucibacter sp. O1-1]MDA3829092.1 SDR family NAD(P)-dependent oxidoreductase [Paucibacter sp. O1-1]